MKILLTNDDGFGAAGLQALIDVLSAHHDVWVVAPDTDRSGVSHGFTMGVPLCLKEKNSQQFSCSGLPADCVDVGIKKVVGTKPDIVISGINAGANIGTDILYSGTAAGARHACMHGIAGLAVSLCSNNHTWNYIPLAQFIAKNIENLKKFCEKDIFVNINASDSQDLQGYAITVPSRRNYQDIPVLYTAPNGDRYSFFNGAPVQTDMIDGTDFTAVQNGFVSIGRILAQPCASELNSDLQQVPFVI